MRARLLSVMPWVLTAALAISTFIFRSRWRSAQNEKVLLKERLVAAPSPVTERPQTIPPRDLIKKETEQERKEHAELMRLRNEVTQLRGQERDFQQIARQADYWQQKARELVTENNRLKSGSTNLESADVEVQRSTCLKNLNDLAAAKQKWAEATQVERGSLADLNEIIPYLTSGRLPFCPSGGNYQINRVGAPPVCSYAGHVLKEQGP